MRSGDAVRIGVTANRKMARSNDSPVRRNVIDPKCRHDRFDRFNKMGSVPIATKQSF